MGQKPGGRTEGGLALRWLSKQEWHLKTEVGDSKTRTTSSSPPSHLSSFSAVKKQLCSQWQVTKAPVMLAQGQSRDERSPVGKTVAG